VVLDNVPCIPDLEIQRGDLRNLRRTSPGCGDRDDEGISAGPYMLEADI